MSLWLTGLKETVEQLPAFVRLAAGDGREREVHLQRLVFDNDRLRQDARAEHSLFEQHPATQETGGDRGGASLSAHELGVTLDASGATEPGLSLKRGAG